MDFFNFGFRTNENVKQFSHEKYFQVQFSFLNLIWLEFNKREILTVDVARVDEILLKAILNSRSSQTSILDDPRARSTHEGKKRRARKDRSTRTNLFLYICTIRGRLAIA